MTIDEFIEKCQKRPIPNNPMGKVNLNARELAEGALNNLWEATIMSDVLFNNRNQVRNAQKFTIQLGKEDNSLSDYFEKFPNSEIANLAKYYAYRWNYQFPNLPLLLNNGFIQMPKGNLVISPKAFSLLDEAEEATVFISYKRSASSAFALLVNDRLKQYGIEPFVDMQLQAGDDWHAELEENIKSSDYFIILLGNKTLESEVTIQEIQWAIEGNIMLIPIWHNGFEYKATEWLNLPDEVSQALSSTHTIRVLEENPLTYDTALRELLNRFGISI